MEQAEKIGELIAKLGFPIVACIILGVLGVYFGRKLVTGHLDFLESNKKSNRIMAKSYKKLAGNHEEVKNDVKTIKTIVERNCGK